jgi:O-antigen ligase
MRNAARGLLLLYVFTIPWEYSLDLGEPWGNVARIVGLLLLMATIPAVFQAGSLRTPGPMQALVLAFYLWLCCSYFWSIEPMETVAKMRAGFQEMMVVWLVWELADNAADMRSILRGYVAGSWVLAALTLVNFSSAEAIAAGQIRFAASGQDPNDVARFLDLGFPLAALLVTSERRWPARLLAAGYLPVGLVAVLLTASRGGFLAAMVALAGSGFLLMHGHPRRLLAGALSLPPIVVAVWFTVPRETLERLATISEQLQGGDLNQRSNIWQAGWQAFVRRPFFGFGAGSFVSAAGLSPVDTAHNTALSIGVSGGVIALFLAAAILAAAVWAIAQTRGPLRGAMGTALVVWFITSLVATVEDNRTTWLLLALIALAGRLAVEEWVGIANYFPATARRSELQTAQGTAR